MVHLYIQEELEDQMRAEAEIDRVNEEEERRVRIEALETNLIHHDSINFQNSSELQAELNLLAPFLNVAEARAMQNKINAFRRATSSALGNGNQTATINKRFQFRKGKDDGESSTSHATSNANTITKGSSVKSKNTNETSVGTTTNSTLTNAVDSDAYTIYVPTTSTSAGSSNNRPDSRVAAEEMMTTSEDNCLRISNIRRKRLVWGAGSLRGRPNCVLSHLEDSEVYICEAVGVVHVHSAMRCVICVSCVGSSMLCYHLNDCTLHVAAKQLRLHGSYNVEVFSHTIASPVIEHCKKIKFGRFHVSYKQLQEQWQDSALPFRDDNVVALSSHSITSFEGRVVGGTNDTNSVEKPKHLVTSKSSVTTCNSTKETNPNGWMMTSPSSRVSPAGTFLLSSLVVQDFSWQRKQPSPNWSLLFDLHRPLDPSHLVPTDDLPRKASEDEKERHHWRKEDEDICLKKVDGESESCDACRPD